MKNPQRLNLCSVIRHACIEAGYSTVKIIGAVNSALGDLEVTKEKATTKNSLVTKQTKNKASLFRINQAVSLSYETENISLPLRFDAWNTLVERMESDSMKTVGTIEHLKMMPLPHVFTEWLDKFAKKDTETVEANS